MYILIIEDDVPTQRMLAEFLSSEGFAVQSALTGERGLALMNDHAFDIVLLDLGLPGMTGHEVLGWMRASLFNMPVLVISGTNNLSAKIREFDWGADDFLLKPFPLLELAARIRAITRRSTGTQFASPLGESFGVDLRASNSCVQEGKRAILRDYLFSDTDVGLGGGIDLYANILRQKLAEAACKRT